MFSAADVEFEFPETLLEAVVCVCASVESEVSPVAEVGTSESVHNAVVSDDCSEPSVNDDTVDSVKRVETVALLTDVELESDDATSDEPSGMTVDDPVDSFGSVKVEARWCFSGISLRLYHPQTHKSP